MLATAMDFESFAISMFCWMSRWAIRLYTCIESVVRTDSDVETYCLVLDGRELFVMSENIDLYNMSGAITSCEVCSVGLGAFLQELTYVHRKLIMRRS